MATLPQTKVAGHKPQTSGEKALANAFEDLLETLPPEKCKGLLKDLRANAEAHGE